MSLGVRDFLDRRQISAFIQPFLECRLAEPERLPLGGCKLFGKRIGRRRLKIQIFAFQPADAVALRLPGETHNSRHAAAIPKVRARPARFG